MPPPSNTTALTAIAISALPYSTTQQVDDAGTTYHVWYSIIVPAGVNLLGIVPYGDATTYMPRIEVYAGPASSPVIHYDYSGNNEATQVPVDPGTEYFIKVRKNGLNPAPANLSLSVVAGPDEPAPTGSLVIIDDTSGFPAVIIDATTGEVLRTVYPFPSTEEGDSIGGRILISNPYDDDEYKLYDADFALVASIPALGSNYAKVRATPAAGLFYVADSGDSDGIPPPVVGTIDTDGTVGPTTWTLPGDARELSALAGNNAGTILYYALGATLTESTAVRRWDLVNDVALSDLVAAVADHVVPDILMLADGSIVVLYFNPLFSSHNATVKRYNAAGATLNTYEFGTNHGMTPRLGYSVTSGAFWIYTHPLTGTYDGYARIFEVRASDGATLTTLTVPHYSAGAYLPGITAGGPVPFGISPSCPIFALTAGEEPEPEPEPGDEDGNPGPIAWLEWRQRVRPAG